MSSLSLAFDDCVATCPRGQEPGCHSVVPIVLFGPASPVFSLRLARRMVVDHAFPHVGKDIASIVAALSEYMERRGS